MKLRAIMRPGPFTITPNDALGAAQRMMTRSHVRHLPVVDLGKLVGMLSERDLLAARARSGPNERWWTRPVATAMSAPAHTAGPEDSLTEAAGRLASEKIGALPVVELGKLLGMVTITDILNAEVRAAMAPHASDATAADAMTPWPLTVHPETHLTDAVALMIGRHVRHLPVVDSASTLVGMLSEADVRTAIGDPLTFLKRHGASVQLRVTDVMSSPPLSVPFDRPMVEVARAFADGRLGALSVVDKFGALVGIISYVDALRVLAG
jgi:CBS domain-containing protein